MYGKMHSHQYMGNIMGKHVLAGIQEFMGMGYHVEADEPTDEYKAITQTNHTK